MICRTLLSLILLGAVLCAGAGGQSVIDRNDMDLSVRPGDDFFRYANGGWIDRTEIPPDKSSFSLKEIMRDKLERDTLSLIEKISRLESVAEGSAEQIIRDLYATGTDFEAIDAEGIEALAPELDWIDGISTGSDTPEVVALFHSIGFDPLFSIRLRRDLKENDTVKLHIGQSGLGLPDREYYLNQGERAGNVRSEYVKHIARMFEIVGEAPGDAAAMASAVMQIETRLARHSLSRVERRNYAANYHPMSIVRLRELCPGFDWGIYFETLSDISFEEVVVESPFFVEEIGRVIEEVPAVDWKAYLRWELLNEVAAYLGLEIAEQDHLFYGAFLSGKKKRSERRDLVLNLISQGLGELLGKLYVEEYFPPESKARMLELTANLRKALALRLENNDWLDESTRRAALAKLSAMRFKIGYPDKWKDHGRLVIKRDSFVRNLIRLSRFLAEQRLARYGKPSDPDEWPLPPQLPNAGYAPQRNEIIFPAGILQTPLLDLTADDAVVYGSIGVGIAHEMIHGFDDQGRKFDRDGKLNNWWTDADVGEYRRRTALLVDQYGEFAPFDDLRVDGELTLGENIADLGGLAVAFAAYKMSLEGKVPPPIDGFTHEQRFFLSFARFFRGKIRDEALRRKIREDKHPWLEFRVNGAPFNAPEFYEIFDILPADRLYRPVDKRPVIW